jgi:hypothetical protein
MEIGQKARLAIPELGRKARLKMTISWLQNVTD